MNCTSCGTPLAGRLDTWGDVGEEMCEICFSAIFRDEQEEFDEAQKDKDPSCCPACHHISLFSKRDAGYQGLFHCADCGIWIDEIQGTQWMGITGIMRISVAQRKAGLKDGAK